MRTILSALVLLLVPGFALAQEADPTKSAAKPWDVDPRCAVMAAHMNNQGALTPACLISEAARLSIQQGSGFRSEVIQQHSVIGPRQRPTPPTDNRE